MLDTLLWFFINHTFLALWLVALSPFLLGLAVLGIVCLVDRRLWGAEGRFALVPDDPRGEA
jgi:hypothetical protein